MRKSAHPRGQFAQFFFHLGGIKVGVSTFFTLGVDLKKFFTLGCTPPHPHPVPIYDYGRVRLEASIKTESYYILKLIT